MNRKQAIDVYVNFLNHYNTQILLQQVQDINEKDKNNIIVDFATGLTDQKKELEKSQNQVNQFKEQNEALKQDKIQLERQYENAKEEINKLQKEIQILNTKKYSIDELIDLTALLEKQQNEIQGFVLFYKKKIGDISSNYEQLVQDLTKKNQELLNNFLGVVNLPNENIFDDASFRNHLGGVLEQWQEHYQKSNDFIKNVQQITSNNIVNYQPIENLNQLEDFLPQIITINEGISKLLQLLQEKKNNSQDQQLQYHLKKAIDVLGYKLNVFKKLILLFKGLIYDQRQLIFKNQQLEQQKTQLIEEIMKESIEHEQRLKNIKIQHDKVVEKLKQKVEQSQISAYYTQKEIKVFSSKGAEIQKQFYESVQQPYQIQLGIILENQLYFLLSATLSDPVNGQNDNRKKIVSEVQQLIEQMQPQGQIQFQDLFTKSIPHLFSIYKDYISKSQDNLNSTLKQCFQNSQVLFGKLQNYQNQLEEQHKRALKAYQELENIRSII